MDGRTLKPGRLYRSGVISRATAARLVADVRVVDLRSAKEQQGDVFDWVDRGDQSQAGAFQAEQRAFEKFGRSASQSEDEMTAVYARLAFNLAPQMRLIAERLIASEQPLLFHCLAGKDRTGTIAAMLLTLVGIEQDQVLADYLATNSAIDATRRFIMAHDPDGVLSSIAPEIWSPMAEARPVYLQAMFDSLESAGGVHGFARQRLGLDSVAIGRLREALLA